MRLKTLFIPLGATIALAVAPSAAVATTTSVRAPIAPATHRIHAMLPAVPGAARAAGNSSTGTGDLLYGGGAVQVGPTKIYAIFWEPPAKAVAPGYNALITRFLSDLGGSSDYGVTSQYYQVANGVQTNIVNASTLAGSWVDPTAYVGPVVLDLQIQNEVTKAIAANGWVAGPDSQFLVYLGNGEQTCDISTVPCSDVPGAGFCAYHSSFTAADGTEVLYANLPYAGNTLAFGGCDTPGSPNGNQAADSEISITDHELLETVTDPSVGSGWVDSSGQENGDKCRNSYGPQAADGSDIVINGHPYLIQETYSNAIHDCAL